MAENTKSKFTVQIRKEFRHRAFIANIDGKKYCFNKYDKLSQEEKKIVANNVPERVYEIMHKRGYSFIKLR